MIPAKSIIRATTLSMIIAFAIIGCAGNNPPAIPSSPAPADGATGLPLSLTLAWTGGDADNDTVTYFLYFGTSPAPPLIADFLAGATFEISGLALNATYYWKVVAQDQYGVKTEGPVWSFQTEANHPPVTPAAPSGPARGWWGSVYFFTVSTTDPEGDSIAYRFAWGDGDTSDWRTLRASGDADSASHAYWETGTFLITARARDTKGAESEWSNVHSFVVTAGVLR